MVDIRKNKDHHVRGGHADMKEIVCGICGEVITDPEQNCPYCGAEPVHFVDGDTVDRQLLRKIYDEGGATY